MNEDDRNPVICPECGGTGSHPWKAGFCPKCHGTGELGEDINDELGEDINDERYKITKYRVASGCFETQ